ncbi:MAG: HRDC domain-containing protein, partial [Bacteroidota bacterium]
MEAAVLTLSFDPKRGGFPSEELEDFCVNKEVLTIESHFFQQEGQVYWTVMVTFNRIIDKGAGVGELNQVERKAYEALRKWRKETAEQAGYPAYLIATNKQLVRMIRKRVRSMSGFDGIKGFGVKRRQAYAEAIIKIIQSFFT